METNKKYIPPHLRKQKEIDQVTLIQAQFNNFNIWDLNQNSVAKAAFDDKNQKLKNCKEIDIEKVLQLACHTHCQEFMDQKSGCRFCPHHEFLSQKRTLKLAKFYHQSTPNGTFAKWLYMKRLNFPNGSESINRCFLKKKQDTKRKDQDVGVRYSSSSQAVPELFERFVRYALDIDIGTDFVNHARQTSQNHNEYSFIDIGFAPGGMSSLLLDLIPNTKGVGINLDPSLGGNVYPPKFDTHDRFKVIMEDIIEIARNDSYEFGTKFDLVIVGITTSGSSQKSAGDIDELELKNLLHFSQLLVAFRNLKEEGSILIRMHLSLRLVDAHLLAFLLENFDPSSFKMTKPLTEFAMRKTFWIHASGYRHSNEAIVRLESLIEQNLAPYASQAPHSEQLNNASLMKENLDLLLQIYGKQMVNILEPMWASQSFVIEAIDSGLNERVCYSCKKSSSNRSCFICKKRVPNIVLQSVMKVNKKLQLYFPNFNR